MLQLWSWKTLKDHGKGHGNSWNFKIFKEYKPSCYCQPIIMATSFCYCHFILARPKLRQSLSYLKNPFNVNTTINPPDF